MSERNGQPPHDKSPEQCYLCSVYLDPPKFDEIEMRADWFYHSANRSIFEAMQDLRSDGTPFNHLAVAERLEAKNQLADVGGADYILEVFDSVSHGWHTDFYAENIRKSWERRDLQRRLTQAQQLAADPTRTIDEIISQLDFDSAFAAGSGEQFHALTAKELAEGDFNITYLIEHVLPECQPCGIFAAFKTLKTSIAVDLSISLATRTPFLGKFFVNRNVRTALMSGESGQQVIQETCHRICHSRNWSFASVENWLFTPDLPNLTDPASIRQLERFIREHEIECLIVDPCYLAMPDVGDDQSKIFKMGQNLKPLSMICQKHNVTPVIVHHNRKHSNAEFKPPELSDVSGSGFAEYVRSWILVSRRSKYEDDGRHRLFLRLGGSAGHSSGWGLNLFEGRQDDAGGRVWEVEVLSMEEAKRSDAQTNLESRKVDNEVKESAQRQTDLDRLDKAFTAFPDGETKRSIRDASGINAQRFDRLFSELITAGAIEQCEVSKNRRTYDGWKRNIEQWYAMVQSGTESPVPVGVSSGTTPPLGGCTSTTAATSREPVVQNPNPVPVNSFDERGIGEPF